MLSPNNEHSTTTSNELAMPEISISVTQPQPASILAPQLNLSPFIESIDLRIRESVLEIQSENIEIQRNLNLRMREFDRERLARSLEESQRRLQQEFEEFQRSLISNHPIYGIAPRNSQFIDSVSTHREFQEQRPTTRNNFFNNRPHQATAPSTNSRPQQTINEKRLQDYITALKNLLSESEMTTENERIENRLCDLRCLMSLELPDTPVNISGERNVYERAQLKHWLEISPENLRRHPITREPVTNLEYNIDIGTQNEIEALLQSLEQRITELTAARALTQATR